MDDGSRGTDRDTLRETLLRDLQHLEASIRMSREGCGEDTPTWSEDVSEEYGDLLQSWYWIKLELREIDERQAD